MPNQFPTELANYLESAPGKQFDFIGSYERKVLREHQSVVIADFINSDKTQRCVFKEAGKQQWKVRDTVTLCSINKRLRELSPTLKHALPGLEVFGPTESWLAMEYVDGKTLDSFITSSRSMPDKITDVFHRLGKIVAELHSFSGADVGLPESKKFNHQYTQNLEDGWAQYILKPFLPSGLKHANDFYKYIDNEVWQRQPSRVLMVDFQPKNVLIGDDGSISLIDPDFSIGSPALGIGFFLNGLNQLAFSHRNWASHEMISFCQQAFLKSYLEKMDSWLSDDLVFFYPWTIVEASKMHALNSRFPAPILKFFYSYFLRRFLHRLCKTSASTTSLDDLSLFCI